MTKDARDRRVQSVAHSGVLGVVLAGGQARRMGGGDKCLRAIGDATLLEHVLTRLAPQFAGGRADIALNANGDPSRFASYDLPVRADPIEGFLGPLVGVLAGLEWAATRGARAIVTAAADTPFPPDDLVARLIDGAHQAGTPLACAETGGRAHPTFGLWPVALAEDLRRALIEDEVRKVVIWTERHGCARVAFDDARDVAENADPDPVADPFFNVNTAEDLAAAEAFWRTERTHSAAAEAGARHR